MVGNRIKQLRLKKRYSINELSEKSGVSKSYLSYIERGIQKNPSLQVLEKLASTLETDVEDLLDQRKNDDTDEEIHIDQEWVLLIQEAINNGITKEDFSYYLDFLKFKKMNEGNDHEQ